jgi:hypothetical protein
MNLHAAAFDKAMSDIYRKAKDEAGYTPHIFLDMLGKYGALGTAKQLINRSTPSDGYAALYERGRLDLTVEAVIIDNPQFHELFTAEELQRCRLRLKQYGYSPK